jgi:hypothetical protein
MADVVSSAATVISGSNAVADGSAAPGTTGKVSDAGHIHAAGVAAQGGAVADPTALTSSAPAAITATDAPAGGTGATAGAYNSAENRDLMIASINATIDDVTEVRTHLAQSVADIAALHTTLDSLLASLRAAGIINT